LGDWTIIVLPSAAVACTLLCAFMVLWLRATPDTARFRSLTYLQWTAAAGGVYSAFGVLHTLNPSDALETSAARIQVVAAALALWSIFKYSEARHGDWPPWLGRWLRGLVTLGVVLYETLGVTGRAHRIPLRGLGVVSATAEQTAFGKIGVTLLSAPLGALALRLFSRARRSRPGGPATALAVGSLAVAGLLDAATTAGLLDLPQLLPIGLTACLLLIASELPRQFREDAAALDRLSANLEHQVEERSNTLAETRERLLRTEKLALVGRLSGGMAHEINNPIAALSANIDYLLAGLSSGALPADARQCLEETRHSATRIGETVRQLLLASRAAAAEVDGESFALDPLLSRSLAEAERRMGSGDWVRRTVTSGLEVAGRGQLVERLLIELLTAASRTASAAKPVELRVTAEDDRVLISMQHGGAWLPATAPGQDGLFIGREPGGDVNPLVVTLNLLLMVGGHIDLAKSGERVEIALTRARPRPAQVGG
jgi:signal transduction histidine kinase